MQLLKKFAARNKEFGKTRPIVIACFGDSVTHGCFEVYKNAAGNIDTFCRAREAYPALLCEKLGELYPFAAPCILNAGVSGDNAKNALTRLERDVLFAKPDLVIVDFGLNDSMNKDVEGGLAAYRAAMRAIFERVLASGAECMLLTPNYMCSAVSPFLTEPLLRGIASEAAIVQNTGILTRYVEAAREEAQKLNVPIADAYRTWQQMEENGVNTDNLLSNYINHPTAEAHKIFLNAIMQTLLQ